MRKSIIIVIIVLALAACVSAQTGQHRAKYGEAKDLAPKVSPRLAVAENEILNVGTAYCYPAADFKPGVVRVGPRTTYLKEGLRIEEVVRLLGKPVSITEQNDNGVVVTIYAFQRGEGRIIIAEFIDGALVRSRTETQDELIVKATR
ncbi:MAG TPA: hypothetical protein VK208_08830 [Pyrinomonadaceae bacterium]|jgi:hypothetical protein|nr:hypothetical protein [Pyrinomonadaceae bacterium]